MNITTRSACCLLVLFAGFLVCGPVPCLAADTAGGLANWFETVAEAERLAEQEDEKQSTPIPLPNENEPAPAAAAIAPAPQVNLDDLRSLVAKRNKLVNDSLFKAVAKLVAGTRPSPQQLQSLTDWFVTYSQMRRFLPTSRKDPNVGAVITVLEEAIRRRADFVEGHILVVPCLLYAGRPDEARTHLEEASKFLHQKSLEPTPFGLDCCCGWLILQEPSAVAGFIDVLRDPRVRGKDRQKLNAYQAMLVSVYSWQTFRFNEAKDYLETSLRRADAVNQPAKPSVHGLLADAAFFYLVAGNPAVRNERRGEELLAKIPAGNQSWVVRRARAALTASKASGADAADAAAIWDAAVRELEACREESLPTLDAEIDEQLAKYRHREPWFRERQKTPAKGNGDAAQHQAPHRAKVVVSR